jgi:ferredoxin
MSSFRPWSILSFMDRESGPIGWLWHLLRPSRPASTTGLCKDPRTKTLQGMDAWLRWIDEEEKRQKKQEAWDRITRQIRAERGCSASNNTPWIVGAPTTRKTLALNYEPEPTITPAGSTRPKEKIAPGLRMKVLERDHYTCRYCGKCVAVHSVVLHVDHIFPESEGGKTTLDNLVTACEDCNLGKGARIQPNAIALFRGRV